MSIPNNLNDIITKVRRITGRPSVNQMTDLEIVRYINTFYIYDFPEHLRLESLRVNYQFTTQANTPVYDFPTNLYLTVMPPVMIAGYTSYMTQSRTKFFSVTPTPQFLQQSLYTGDGTNGSGGNYTGQFLTAVPVIPGFKQNPPGAYSSSAITDVAARYLNWNVLISAAGNPNPISGTPTTVSLVDDGQGNLFDPSDISTLPANARGTVNYLTGAVTITNFASVIPVGNPINAQSIPYVASRPQSVVFYQDQFMLYPVPDQAYTVSFEAYKYPVAFIDGNLTGQTPQINEWWQLLAYGAADKIFADNADFENLQKFRPLLDEQMTLMQRRTIVQQTSERTATIYTEQNNGQQFPFGNLFGGF